MTAEPAGPFLIDARDVGINHKGVERVLLNVCRVLAAQHPGDYHVACTAAGRPLLDEYFPPDAIHVAPRTPQALWEQLGLPLTARRARARAVYSHRECGALWGPALLLHVPEDPEVRWRRNPPTTPNARARVAYSRSVLRQSIRRAHVAVSTPSIANDLGARLGIAADAISVIPLGVDTSVFHPTPADDLRYFFHLASGDARDHSALVVEAYGRLAIDNAPQLVIGGGIGDAERASLLRDVEREVAARIRFTGRLTDTELVEHYSGSVAYVQPSSDEGFGLQQLEALACGALPVVVAIPPVVDVVGDGVVLWAAAEVPAFTAAMERAALDASLVEDARRRNPVRAAAFSWERTGGAIHDQLCALPRR